MSTPLENIYVALVKAVNDGAKTNNLLLKFETLCAVDSLVDRMSKQEVDAIASKWITTLYNCLLQTTGTSLAHVIGGLLSRLFDYPSGSKSSTSIVKNIITALQARSTPVPIRSSLTEVLGIISKNSKTLAIVFLNDSFALLAKQIKSGENKAQSIKALALVLESIQGAGSAIHLECFKLVKNAYQPTTSTVELKIDTLNAVVPIIRHYNQTDIKLDGLDKKILTFISKAFEDDNLTVHKRAAEVLGIALSILYYKDNNNSNSGSGHSQTMSPPVMKSTLANMAATHKTAWNLEVCQNYLGSMFVAASKKEMKINVTIAFSTFLQNLKLADLERSVDSVLTFLLKLMSPANRNLSSTADLTQARTCMSHILRHGLGEKLGESGQQAMVRYLTNILMQAETMNELTIVVTLRELSQLLFELGEGGIVMVDDISTQLFTLLNDKNQSTRQWASLCLRSLVSNIPKHTSKYLGHCLAYLNSILEEFEKPNIQPEPLKKIMNSVKGNALGIAALISTLKDSELGVPASLLNQITKTASILLTNPDFLNPATERDIVIFSKTRADALVPLHSLIIYNGKLVTPKIVASIVTFLGNTLKTVSELPAISSSFQLSTNELTQLLELNLIKTFQALSPQAYAAHHTMLMTVVTSLILDGTQNTILPSLLSKDDEDTLLPDFTSIHYQFESMFLVPLSTQDSSFSSFSTFSDAFSPKHTQSLDIRVVNSCIELFSTLFTAQPDRHRTQLLDHLANCIKESSNPLQKNNMVINSMATVFFILKSMSSSNMTFGKNEVAGNIQRFVQKYFGDVNPLLRRVSAETLGLLCRIEGDSVTAAIIKSLTDIIRKPSKEVPSTVRAGSAFVLGCIQRSVGGMMSQKYLPSTIANLHVLAQDLVSPDVSTYALHALYITIQTSGFAFFFDFASPTLMLLQTLLVNENPPYQLLGRVVNSIVVAMGPELEHKKDVLAKCSSTCSIIERHESPQIRVESIYYKQKLILFAPATINETVVPFLISQFKSPYLMLRISSVTCLRQLLQKKSNIDLGMNIVEDLFMMIDIESDKQLQKELKLLLNTVVDTMASSNPSTWLCLCMNIILSSKQMAKETMMSIESTGGGSPTSPGGLADDEEKDDDEDVKVVVESRGEGKVEYVYRWFTKVIAIECVRRVISVVRNKPEHFNMLLASNNQQHANKNDYLIYHLHELVGIAFKAATSQIESMRPIGILLLKDILEGFQDSIDPDYEGHLLLELYQAQIMSALRPAFSADQLPNLLSVGCSVFVNFVEGSLHYDNSALKKTTTQLSSSVKDLRKLNFPIYNEKATTLVQLSILKTFAQLYLLCLKKESLNTILSQQVIAPILPHLRVHWITFLKEYSLLVSQPPTIYHLCNPMFFSPLTYTESIDYFKDAYPFIVRALASLIGTPYWMQGRNVEKQPSESSNDGDNDDKSFLCETTSIDDLNVVLGLSILPQEKFLSDPAEKNVNVNNMILTLETMLLVFQPSSISIDEISIVKIQEVCQVLLRISAFTTTAKGHRLIIDVVGNLFQCFGDSITKE
eukprot:gene461-552_t